MDKNKFSNKDLSYLSDAFEWNLNIYNTCSMFESQIHNEELKSMIIDIKEEHKDSCNTILEILGGVK